MIQVIESLAVRRCLASKIHNLSAKHSCTYLTWKMNKKMKIYTLNKAHEQGNKLMNSQKSSVQTCYKNNITKVESPAVRSENRKI